MNNVYVNATSHDEWGTLNTDGADTVSDSFVVLLLSQLIHKCPVELRRHLPNELDGH